MPADPALAIVTDSLRWSAVNPPRAEVADTQAIEIVNALRDAGLIEPGPVVTPESVLMDALKRCGWTAFPEDLDTILDALKDAGFPAQATPEPNRTGNRIAAVKALKTAASDDFGYALSLYEAKELADAAINAWEASK